MTVVEPAADPLSRAVDNIDDAAARELGRRLLDHLLENPGMVGAPFDLEADLRQRVGHVVGAWCLAPGKSRVTHCVHYRLPFRPPSANHQAPSTNHQIQNSDE